MKKLLALALVLSLCFVVFVSCGKDPSDPWSYAKYTKDKTFGEGSKSVEVEVKVNDNSVTFTIKSDEETLGAALLAHELIDGEEGQFGLYIKKVNGITADYDVDGSYWGFYKNGEYMMTGVDSTVFLDGEHYELVYEK